ncbi:hypothetical protein [Planctobacterium marinum]|uniref:Lipoprotein n=1 Tax=Planctobacterium marinum TaxID=1631968 RepID=A0AA48KR83_9ALTE|nr:hypothetical protein MACH26_06850 [Planctobacterium marinum]
MKILFLMGLMLFTSGCVTGYQAYTWSGGYKDQQIGVGRYWVEYLGNASTSPELVLERWHKRASELCPDGYDEVGNEEGANQSTAVGVAGSAVIPISFSHPYVKGEIECKN